MAMIRAGDVNLEYHIDGSGPPLLLIQGFGARAQSWGSPLMAELTPHFTTIRFSPAGVGESEAHANPPLMPDLANDAAALLTALGLPKVHVFGRSMGGMIAQELALNHPDRVLGLVLGCTHCGASHAPQAAPEVLQSLMDSEGTEEERTRRQWAFVMAPGWEDNALAVKAAEEDLRTKLEVPFPRPLLMQHMAAIQLFDTYDRLPSLQAPTLVLHGDGDRLVLPEHGRVIAERIPGAELRMIENTGHMFFNEKPHETARLIREFLARVPAAA